MIIDFHAHIFPRAVRENREAFFPAEPAFKLLYSAPGSRLVGASEIIAAMDEHGVDRSVVFGFPWQNASTFIQNNDYIMQAVQRYPQRLIGLGCLDPFHDHAEAEALRCLDGGLAGLGELAFYHSGIDVATLDRLAPLMTACRERDRLVLIHTNEPVGHVYPGKTPNTLKQIYGLIQRFADNKIVLAHWGGGLFFFNLLKKEVKENLKHVYFDTAASPFLYDSRIYRLACEIVGPDKILFGSDFPLLAPSRYFQELEHSGLPTSDIAAVCGGNAARLLGISP